MKRMVDIALQLAATACAKLPNRSDNQRTLAAQDKWHLGARADVRKAAKINDDQTLISILSGTD